MSRRDNWIPLDKNLAQVFKTIKNRPFSKIEATFAYTLDQDNNKKWTVSGYAKQWKWSRNKVKSFVESLKTHCGHIKDTTRTYYKHPIHFIDKGLWEIKDTLKTHCGHIKDTLPITTTKPNNNKHRIKRKKRTKKEKEIILFLESMIVENNFEEVKDSIFKFFKYRNSEFAAKDRYNTELKIKGLMRHINGCRSNGLDVNDCIQYAMEQNWKTPNPEYFKQNKYVSAGSTNTETCIEWAES